MTHLTLDPLASQTLLSWHVGTFPVPLSLVLLTVNHPLNCSVPLMHYVQGTLLEKTSTLVPPPLWHAGPDIPQRWPCHPLCHGYFCCALSNTHTQILETDTTISPKPFPSRVPILFTRNTFSSHHSQNTCVITCFEMSPHLKEPRFARLRSSVISRVTLSVSFQR